MNIVSAKIANVLRFIAHRQFIEVGDTLSPNYIHYFNEDEVEAELREAGFQIQLYLTKPYGHAVGIADITDTKGSVPQVMWPSTVPDGSRPSANFQLWKTTT